MFHKWVETSGNMLRKRLNAMCKQTDNTTIPPPSLVSTSVQVANDSISVYVPRICSPTASLTIRDTGLVNFCGHFLTAGFWSRVLFSGADGSGGRSFQRSREVWGAQDPNCAATLPIPLFGMDHQLITNPCVCIIWTMLYIYHTNKRSFHSRHLHSSVKSGTCQSDYT